MRDPFRLYREKQPFSGQVIPRRRRNKLRRLVAQLVFNPDPGVVWARAVVSDPDVLSWAKGAQFVLSSSPPESAHLAAAALARRLSAELIVDMRDGWLDEPLKPLLQKYRFQQWREGRLEKKVLAQAKHIFVTSDVWRELLARRLPSIAHKLTVLTNACPTSNLTIAGARKTHGTKEELTLVHLGRFTASRSTQKITHILEPFRNGARNSGAKGRILFFGELIADDWNHIARWEQPLNEAGWSLETRGTIPREEVMAIMSAADGLLLLSASKAAIPCKLFEYLVSGKPILSATMEGSAVWNMCANIPQAFNMDYTKTSDAAVVQRYLEACRQGDHGANIPEEYTEGFLANKFYLTVGLG